MSIVFFNDVLTFLGKRVNYDAVVNYAGNSFAKDSWKTIQEANPLIKHKKRHAFADMFSEVAIKQEDNIKKALPGNTWFDLNTDKVGDITDEINKAKESGGQGPMPFPLFTT